MKLQTVRISGFRSIEATVEVAVGSPTVLAGHNDAGKSAIIDAIAYLLDAYKLNERDRTYAGTDDNGEAVRIESTWVEGHFELRPEEQALLGLGSTVLLRRRSGKSGSAALELLASVPEDTRYRDLEAQTVAVLQDRLKGLGLARNGAKAELIARLAADAIGKPEVEEWVPASADLKRAIPRVQRFDATSTQNPEEAILGALKTSYTAHLEDEGIEGDVKSLTRKLEELVVEDAEELRQHIKSQCGDVGDIEIRPTVQLSGGLKATEISVTNERGEVVHLGQSGAGRARRIALAVWEYNARLLSGSGEDTVLLYDEPDTHLDYRNQRGFMRLLDEQSALDNVRIVIATHSMNLIDGVDIAGVLHVRHDQNRTTVSSITDDSEVGQHLGAIAASLGLRNTVLLHERLFVGVEGETESRAFPVLFRLATGRHLESCGVAIWPCSNNDGALRFAQFLTTHQRQVLLVVDTDSRDQKIFSDDSLQRHNLDPSAQLLLIGAREFEDTFSDAQWVDCANTNWPRADGRPWTPDHFAQHREGKFSSQVLAMLRSEGSVELSGKPQVMTTMALSLQSAEEVPESLRHLFDELIARAA